MRNHILFILAFVLSLSLHAQEKSLILQGKVLDKATQEGIPFVSIGILGTSVGTYSNENGVFYLAVPAIHQAHNIVFDCLGYQARHVKVSDLYDAENVNFFLTATVDSLQEVVVLAKKLAPKKIIKRTLRKLTRNYPSKRFELKGYYKEYIFNPRKEPHYLGLEEAIIRIQDRGLLTPPDSAIQMEILQYREGNDYLPSISVLDSMAVQSLMQLFTGQKHFNKIYQTYGLDIVRHKQGNNLTSSPFRNNAILNQDLHLEGVVKINEQWCYHISSQSKTVPSLNVESKKVNYEEKLRSILPEGTPANVVDSLLKRVQQKSTNIFNSTPEQHYFIQIDDFALLRFESKQILAGQYYARQVDYQKVGKKYYPKIMRLIKPELFRSDDREKPPYSHSVLLVTEIKEQKIKKIKRDQQFASDMYLKEVAIKYRPMAWENETQIPFDSSIYQEIIEQIKNSS